MGRVDDICVKSTDGVSAQAEQKPPLDDPAPALLRPCRPSSSQLHGLCTFNNGSCLERCSPPCSYPWDSVRMRRVNGQLQDHSTYFESDATPEEIGLKTARENSMFISMPIHKQYHGNAVCLAWDFWYDPARSRSMLVTLPCSRFKKQGTRSLCSKRPGYATRVIHQILR